MCDVSHPNTQKTIVFVDIQNKNIIVSTIEILISFNNNKRYTFPSYYLEISFQIAFSTAQIHETLPPPSIHHSDLGLHIRNDSFNFINWFTVPKKKNSPYSFKKISYFFFNNNLKNPSASNTKKKKKKVPVSGIIYVSRWRWWWWASLRGFHHLKHCRVHFFRFSHVFHSWFSHCFATTSNFVLCVCACVRVVMPPCVMQIAWCTPSADRAYRRLTPPAASKRRGQGQRPTHGIKKKSFIFKCFLCFSLKMWKNYISCAISPHFKRTSICVFFTSDLL